MLVLFCFLISDEFMQPKLFINLCICSCLQDLAVPRCFPPPPESGEMPEDEDTENVAEEVDDSEATEEEADDADNYVVEQRPQDVETLSDTESSPEAQHGFNADVDALVDAAPSAPPPTAQKRSAGVFAEEDSLFSS